jgi:protein TonB
VYTYVEQMPTLAGGGNGYIDQVLGRAISRLVVMRGRKTEGGRVVLEAVVEPDGTLGRLKIRSTATPALAEAVLAAAHRVPKLTPGQQSGTPVPVRLMLPIRVEVQ